MVKGPIASTRKRVLVLGCSTGYGLASRIVTTFGSQATPPMPPWFQGETSRAYLTRLCQGPDAVNWRWEVQDLINWWLISVPGALSHLTRYPLLVGVRATHRSHGWTIDAEPEDVKAPEPTP